MPKQQEIIDADNWLEHLQNEKASIARRGRKIRRAEKVFTILWVVSLTVGMVMTFFMPGLASYLVFVSVIFAGLGMDCSGYLWGVAEGRLEHNLDDLIEYEKERRKNAEHFESGK